MARFCARLAMKGLPQCLRCCWNRQSQRHQQITHSMPTGHCPQPWRKREGKSMEQWKCGACQELAREGVVCVHIPDRPWSMARCSACWPVHVGRQAAQVSPNQPSSTALLPVQILSPINQCQAASGFRLNLQHPFEGFRSSIYSQKVVRGPPLCSSSWAVGVRIFLMDAQDLHHLSSHARSPGAPLIIWQPLQLTASLLQPAQHAVKLLQAAILLPLAV